MSKTIRVKNVLLVLAGGVAVSMIAFRKYKKWLKQERIRGYFKKRFGDLVDQKPRTKFEQKMFEIGDMLFKKAKLP